MKILITGGAGFVGTNLAERLVTEGHSITVIDDYSTGKFDDNHLNDVSYIQDDITNAVGKYDIIFHLAALSRIQPSFDDPDETFKSVKENILLFHKKIKSLSKNKMISNRRKKFTKIGNFRG